MVEAKEGDRGLSLQVGEKINPILAPLGLVFRRINSAVEADTGLGASRWFVLVSLGEQDGISQVELCRPLELDPSRMSRLTTAMKKEGLVDKERDAEDNRVVRIYLTKQGRALLRELPAHRERFEARVREILGEKSLENLREDLYVLAEGLDER